MVFQSFKFQNFFLKLNATNLYPGGIRSHGPYIAPVSKVEGTRPRRQGSQSFYFNLLSIQIFWLFPLITTEGNTYLPRYTHTLLSIHIHVWIELTADGYERNLGLVFTLLFFAMVMSPYRLGNLTWHWWILDGLIGLISPFYLSHIVTGNKQQKSFFLLEQLKPN
jgi:hypothetical protein